MVKITSTLILSFFLLCASLTIHSEEPPEFPQVDQQQVLCLTEAIYFEARGESHIGKLAVANVILNRTKSERFPSTVCGVIRQKGQFSYDPRQKIREWRTWFQTKMLAEYVLLGQAVDPTRGSLFFGNLTQPFICVDKQKRIIGNHRFC